MSKTSKSVSYTKPNGTFSISGGPSATYKNGSTSYKLNDLQQQAYDYAQKEFANNLSSVNAFSSETLKSLQDEVNAYKNNALTQLDDIYTPMLQQTRNDAARRFGNLDNSVFLQNLDSVEKKRSNAMNLLAQSVASKQSDLINQELQNRYNYLNFLNNYQNQIMGNAISASGLANNAANMDSQYQTAYNNYAAINTKNNISMLTNLLMQAGQLATLI